MAFTKEVLDEILKDYRGPDDFYGHEGIVKQLAKALVKRTMEAELTGHPGYEPELTSRAASEVKEPAAEWQGRPLEPFCPVLFPDALGVNIRDGGTYGFPRSHYRRVPPDRSTDAHRSPGAQLNTVRPLQRAQGGGRRLEEDLPGPIRRSAGGVRCCAGREAPGDCKILEDPPERDYPVFQVFSGNQEGCLYTEKNFLSPSLPPACGRQVSSVVRFDLISVALGQR
jgi:hypothetical protein